MSSKPKPNFTRAPRPGLPSAVDRTHQLPNCRSADISICGVCGKTQCLECTDLRCIHPGERPSYQFVLQ